MILFEKMDNFIPQAYDILPINVMQCLVQEQFDYFITVGCLIYMLVTSSFLTTSSFCLSVYYRVI